MRDYGGRSEGAPGRGLRGNGRRGGSGAEAPHRGRAALGGGRSARGARADPALPAAPGLEPPGTSFVSARAVLGDAPRGRVVVAAALPLPAPPRSGPAGAISEGAISVAPPRGCRSSAAALTPVPPALGGQLEEGGKRGAGEKRRCALEAL